MISKLTTIVALSAILLCSAVSATAAGIATSVDIGVVQNVKNYAMPMMIHTINTMTIPDMEVDDFTITNMKVDLDPIDPQYIQIALDQADNAIVMTAQNIAGVIKGDFKYKWFIISCHGSFEADIEKGGASMSMKMPLLAQSINNKLLPGIDIKDLQLSINKKKVDISLSGSIMADIADLFVDIFEGLVIDMLESEIEKHAPAIIVQEVNTAFQQSGGQIVIPELGSMAFDYAFTAHPNVSDSQIDVYVNGTVFNATFGEISPNEGFGDLTVDTASKNMVQLDVSQYTADSLMLTLHEAGKLQFKFDNNTIPELTTTFLDGLLPGLVDKYGDNVPMAVFAKTSDFPRAIFNPGDLGMNFSVDFDFQVRINKLDNCNR